MQWGGPAGWQELSATGCSIAPSPSCPPHRQHFGGSQWVPGTQPASGLRAETPPEQLLLGTMAGADLSPSPVPCELPVWFCGRGRGPGSAWCCTHMCIPVGAGLHAQGPGRFAPALARQQLMCISWCTPSPCSSPTEVFSLENGSINTSTSQGKLQPS